MKYWRDNPNRIIDRPLSRGGQSSEKWKLRLLYIGTAIMWFLCFSLSIYFSM